VRNTTPTYLLVTYAFLYYIIDFDCTYDNNGLVGDMFDKVNGIINH